MLCETVRLVLSVQSVWFNGPGQRRALDEAKTRSVNCLYCVSNAGLCFSFHFLLAFIKFGFMIILFFCLSWWRLQGFQGCEFQSAWACLRRTWHEALSCSVWIDSHVDMFGLGLIYLSI